MAFKLGDKRVNPLKSRGFMNASPFKSNGNTMAFANGEPEGEKPKEVLVSSISNVEKVGEQKTPEELAAEKARLQKLADETQESQSVTFDYGKGGSAESVWKTLSDEEKAKFGSVENFRKETDAYNKKMSQTVSADPNAIKEAKVNPRQVAKPTAAEVGQNLKNQLILQFRGKKVYDSETEKMRPYTEAEIMDQLARGQGNQNLYAQYNEHMAGMKAANAENKSTIGVTGDQQELDTVVAEQLEDKTNQSNTVNNE